MSTGRVLVVEDDPAVRHSTARALRLDRFEVLEAPDGRCALELLAIEGVDAILVDVMMPEIEAYLRRVTREQGVEPHVRFHTTVQSATWISAASHWRVQTSRGPITADILVAAPGGLSEPSVPQVPGLDRFAGTVFHSATWNHAHQLDGERVAVVGTGASAIQLVPRIQSRVEALHLFQRTPPWVMPHSNRPISELERRAYRRVPALQRLNRALVYWARELLVLGFAKDRRLMRIPIRLARRHIAQQVADPVLRDKVTPSYTGEGRRVGDPGRSAAAQRHLARHAPKLTSTFSSSTRSSVLAAWRRARRSPRVSGGFMRLRGHRWRLRTTLISAARTVTWEPR